MVASIAIDPFRQLERSCIWIVVISKPHLSAMTLVLGTLLAPLSSKAASSEFDLSVPKLEITVMHDGNNLPRNRLPNHSKGDRI